MYHRAETDNGDAYFHGREHRRLERRMRVFLKDMFWSIALFGIFNFIGFRHLFMEIPHAYITLDHYALWWVPVMSTAFWGTFGAIVVCPAAREHARRRS